MDTSGQAPQRQALEGLRILDLTDEKGMFCCKLLADMGADVIKIERPGGDRARELGPFAKEANHPNASLFFWYHNTNKRGVTLNLEIQEGQEIFRKVAKGADVIAETLPPNRAQELGLDYASLSKFNPRLIVTSITNFGQTGPYRDHKACGLVSSALGGQMYVCGEVDTPPLTPYGDQASLVASLFAAIGTLMAVHHRHATEQGQHVDISIHESVVAAIEHVNVRYSHEGIVSKRQGSLTWNNAFRLFPCQDGHVVASLFQQWDTLVEWLDTDGKAADLAEEKWRFPENRASAVGHISEVIEGWTQTCAAEELVDKGQLMHFPWAKVDSVDDVANNPQLAERDFFVEVSHPELGLSLKYPGAPYRFTRSPWQLRTRAPLVGEHNEEIYRGELGLSKEDLAELASRGIF
jgi:benzylsuccinate CoA-transferase BbsE subunit